MTQSGFISPQNVFMEGLKIPYELKFFQHVLLLDIPIRVKEKCMYIFVSVCVCTHLFGVQPLENESRHEKRENSHGVQQLQINRSMYHYLQWHAFISRLIERFLFENAATGCSFIHLLLRRSQKHGFPESCIRNKSGTREVMSVHDL